MKKIYSILLMSFLLQCTEKGQMKGARSFINNQTNHFIEILIYQNGKIVSTNQSVTIPANSNKEVENISESTTSYAFNLISYDSLEVKFDNSSFLIHYLKAEGDNPLAH